jgi:hypothetical protein
VKSAMVRSRSFTRMTMWSSDRDIRSSFWWWIVEYAKPAA